MFWGEWNILALFLPTYCTWFCGVCLTVDVDLLQIVNNPLHLPDGMNPLLKDLIQGLLCRGLSWRLSFGGERDGVITNACVTSAFSLPFLSQLLCYIISSLIEIVSADPELRMTLEAVAGHAWVIGEAGPIPQYSCWCKHRTSKEEFSDGGRTDLLSWQKH